MILRKSLDWRIIIRRTWKRTTTLFVLSSLVAIAYHLLWFDDLAISTLPASILGVAIAFLIGFRVNSAYERWWEARKIWGALVNDTRSWARQVMFLIPTPATGLENEAAHQIHRELLYRQLAFVYALKNHLRKLPIAPEIQAFLSAEEVASYEGKSNIPNSLLQKQASRLRDLATNGHLDNFRLIQLDHTLNRLCDEMGACERIKNTVFPRQYSYYSTLFTKIYSFILPFVLVGETGWLVIPFTMLIGFVFYALDIIAYGIDNPFENTLNDTPMSAICRTLEINLREQLGEKELPEPLQPVNGFLF